MAKITIPETTVEKKTDGRSFPSAEKLEKLKLAREKAYAIRAEQRELKDKELLVKKLEREKREKEVNTKLKELVPAPIPAKPESPEPPQVPVKPKKKTVKQIVIESESDSDSDDEPVVVYRKVKKVKEPVKEVEPEPVKITEDHLSQSHINNEIKRLRREMAKKSLFKAF